VGEVVGPDDIVIEPPSLLLPPDVAPTIIEMLPAEPLVAAPEPKNKDPVLPTGAAPVLMEMDPLTPPLGVGVAPSV
jgi:hypothetical protein